MFFIFRAFVCLLCSFFLLIANSAVAKDSFPNKPITLLVGYAPGGTADLAVRHLAESVSKRFEQPVVIRNKPGASGVISLTELAAAPADGYTLGVLATGPIISAHMQELSIDPQRDFTPVIQTGSAIYGLVVKADSPFKTVRDLVTYAQSHPGEVTYSTSGAGSPQHLVMLELGSDTGVEWTHVPTTGGLPAINLLLGGHVTAASQTTEWKPFVDAGRLRLLVLYADKRIDQFPDTPTLVESGWNIVAPSVYSLVAPAGLAKDKVEVLHAAFKEAMFEPGYAELLHKLQMNFEYADPAGLQKRIDTISKTSATILAKLPKQP